MIVLVNGGKKKQSLDEKDTLKAIHHKTKRETKKKNRQFDVNDDDHHK